MAVGEFLTWAVQAQNAPAHVGRLLQSVLLNEGVVDKAGNSFKVAQDTGSNMQVKIGSGTLGDLAVVEGDDVAGQGNYVSEAQNATVTRVIAASDPSNPRIDRVVLQNYDNEADSSGLNDADVEVIQGTPAGSPSAPALPASAVSLATIAVGAGVTAIVDANITDTRAEAKRSGELVVTQYHTGSATFTKADFPWLRTVRVRLVAGGGGGGGAATTGAGASAIGGGGAGGGYKEATVLAADMAASEPITVGGGGAGGTTAPGNGGTGGSSIFGSPTLCSASGGAGGGLGAAGTGVGVGAAGGTGGTPGTGDFGIQGGDGHNTRRSDGAILEFGHGGNSMLSAGFDNESATSSGATGVAGRTYGGGGGGGFNHASQGTARAGGAGADGLIILELYA